MALVATDTSEGSLVGSLGVVRDVAQFHVHAEYDLRRADHGAIFRASLRDVESDRGAGGDG